MTKINDWLVQKKFRELSALHGYNIILICIINTYTYDVVVFFPSHSLVSISQIKALTPLTNCIRFHCRLSPQDVMIYCWREAFFRQTHVKTWCSLCKKCRDASSKYIACSLRLESRKSVSTCSKEYSLQYHSINHQHQSLPWESLQGCSQRHKCARILSIFSARCFKSKTWFVD